MLSFFVIYRQTWKTFHVHSVHKRLYVVCFGSCSTKAEVSYYSEVNKSLSLSDLPNEILVRILAYTFDSNMYSDEHDIEYNDVTWQLLMSTSNRWLKTIQDDEHLFNSLRRRYLCKYVGKFINLST